MTLYLAGPLGFSEAGRQFLYSTLIPVIAECGQTVVDPWSLTASSEIDTVSAMPPGEARRRAWMALNNRIAKRNHEALDRCDAVLAVLDGADVDSGTAAEIGYAFAVGKQISGYRSDFRLAGDNEGAVVNLQVEYFVRMSGGRIVASVAELQDLLHTR